ncbi:MAG TPA: c-type cytochrome [Bryobacteraceae bacterium]|nr:c-type cytochrome [Bryobacteraceae bacterium]
MKSALLFALFSVLAAAQSDDTQGRKLFEGHCALCHGETGLGGRGPNLAQPALSHAPTDEQLVAVIKQGIPGTEMPGAWQLDDREAKLLAGYVRSLGKIAVEPLPGDPNRGRELYAFSGCAGCHIVRGDGTGLGPELSDIGARRNAAYLRESLVQPGASVPERYLTVTVTTREGKTIRGIRINEDTFTIQVRDAANRLYSFRKSDLVSAKKEFHQSLMPSYEARFTAAQLDDLVAYLAGLRGLD